MPSSTAKQTIQIDNFIGGQYEASKGKETFETTNPATGGLLGNVALGTADDIDRAVKAAKEAVSKGPWPKMSVAERCAILKKIGDLILERKEQIARAETLDTGKPISETLNGDIPRSALN